MLSHVFFMVFIYLFSIHRYSRGKTIAICFTASLVMNVLDYFKLNLFADSALFYFFTTITQIAIAQFSGLLVSKNRDSKMLFISLSHCGKYYRLDPVYPHRQCLAGNRGKSCDAPCDPAGAFL